MPHLINRRCWRAKYSFQSWPSGKRFIFVMLCSFFLLLAVACYVAMAEELAQGSTETEWDPTLFATDPTTSSLMETTSTNDNLDWFAPSAATFTPVSLDAPELLASTLEIPYDSVDAQCPTRTKAGARIRRSPQQCTYDTETENSNTNNNNSPKSKDQYDPETIKQNDNIVKQDQKWDFRNRRSGEFKWDSSEFRKQCTERGPPWWWMPVCCLGPEAPTSMAFMGGSRTVLGVLNCEIYFLGRPRCMASVRNYCCHGLSKVRGPWGFKGEDCIKMYDAPD